MADTAKTLLVDARAEVRAALEAALADTEASVRQSWPTQPNEGTIVTWGEYQNTSTDCSVVDSISYQVDLWAERRETVVTLSALVNTALVGMGFKRLYSSPDEGGKTPLGYEHKCFRFGRKVDKRTLRLVD